MPDWTCRWNRPACALWMRGVAIFRNAGLPRGRLLSRQKKARIAVTVKAVSVLNGMGVSLFHKLEAHERAGQHFLRLG